MTTDKTKKLLMDTDIADAPDDAFALYMAMCMGADIVGVTTVFRDTEKRAETVKELLSAFGGGYENVPVVAGNGDKKTDDAADLIIDCCKKYGKELTVIAIGPFTNIARVIEKDPEALSLADKVVIMGGAYYKQYADWNVMCDVESAAKMFENVENLQCIGADVTHLLDIGEENAQRLIDYKGKNKAAAYVCRLYALWYKENPNDLTVLHDPLAVYYALHPEVCSTELAPVTVITDGAARGMTLNLNAYSKTAMNPFYSNIVPRTVKVAKTVDKNSFIDTFMKLFDE